MSERMYPIPFRSLMNWAVTEYAREGEMFGVHSVYRADGKTLPIFGEKIETPFGPAAGPNSQLAQNIIASYLAGARFFEQVGNGRLVEIDRSDITITSIPANKITYVGYDWAGRVDKLVLNDVTGDRYDYGIIHYQPAGYQETPGNPNGNGEYKNGEISVTNGSFPKGMTPYVVGSVDGAKTNRMGGVAGSLDQLDGQNRMAAFMPLNEAKGIRRAQFDTDAMLLTTNSMVIPISDAVECYNKTTGAWYELGKDGDHKAALNLALAFSDDITVYYDRSPEEGGKVRIVVVE